MAAGATARRRGLIALADGSTLSGTVVGGDGVATGEVVFNTAMTGYQEIITDPSYAGQLITFTSPHVGNYGVTPSDDQSDRVHASGVILRSLSPVASSWRAEGTLHEYLATRNILAVTDVDTRRLTRLIRERGAMPAAVGTDVDEADLISLAAAAPPMAGTDLASSVSTPVTYRRDPTGASRGHVVALDLGMKRAIVKSFTDRGISVTVVPAATGPEAIIALDPDGLFLSNGPGDPEPLEGPIATVRALLGAVPTFGICLGHQVLGLALGARTYKLPFGHHGGNHPVRRLVDGAVEITAQNHGFAVDLWDLARVARPEAVGLWRPCDMPTGVETSFGIVDGTHQNLNDGTNEGLACRDVQAFSVQYHPEAAPGPNDATRLFDHFADTIARPDAAA